MTNGLLKLNKNTKIIAVWRFDVCNINIYQVKSDSNVANEYKLEKKKLTFLGILNYVLNNLAWIESDYTFKVGLSSLITIML